MLPHHIGLIKLKRLPPKWQEHEEMSLEKMTDPLAVVEPPIGLRPHSGSTTAVNEISSNNNTYK